VRTIYVNILYLYEQASACSFTAHTTSCSLSFWKQQQVGCKALLVDTYAADPVRAAGLGCRGLRVGRGTWLVARSGLAALAVGWVARQQDPLT
jgi:hypothetical protein